MDALAGDAAQTPAETGDEIKATPKSKRIYGGKKSAVRSNLTPRMEYSFLEDQIASQENLLPNGDMTHDAKPVENKDVEIPTDLD